jgi:hypothetical protein
VVIRIFATNTPITITTPRNMMNAFFIANLSKHVSAKARETFSYLGVLLILSGLSFGLSSCGNDQINLPDKKLEGTIGTKEWNSDKANAYTFSSDFKYQVKFLSSEEPTGSDPCSAPSPSKPYISAVFKPSEGSFSFSTVLIDPNQVVVKIHPSTSKEFIVTNGFMEIYIIDNAIMYGYIQAIYDDENTVEGSFEVRLCN